MKGLREASLTSKRVLVRVDFNCPLKDGVVADDTRIVRALPTINYLLNQKAKVILCSHLGRPKGEGFEEEFSLAPVAKRLSELVSAPVHFCAETVGNVAQEQAEALGDGEILLLENLRFDKAEKKNDPDFSRALASLAELYVGDAFGCAHRAHASVAGVPALLDSYAGFLLQEEVDTITGMIKDPKRPFAAILGGSKVSDKIGIIEALLETCDTIVVGGGMCFTFLLAQGYTVGASLQESDWVSSAISILDIARARGVNLLLPVDVVVADRFAPDAQTQICNVDAIPEGWMGLDIGPKTQALYTQALSNAKTIFCNGPMGVFEMEAFAEGTKKVMQAVADNAEASSIIGGGDSVAACNAFGLSDKMSFISTGGGASMELVQGKSLPGVAALDK